LTPRQARRFRQFAGVMPVQPRKARVKALAPE